MGKNYGVIDLLNMAGDGNPLGTDFYCHRCDEVKPREQANVTDEVGEYDPSTHHTFNEVRNFEAEYVCKIREVVSGVTIDTGSDDALSITSIVIQQVNKEYARIRMTAHEHPQEDAEHINNQRTIVLPAFLGFGANDFLDVFDSELDVQRAEYTVTLGHQDDQNNIGEHLTGRSQGEMHTVVVEAITDEVPGVPDAPWKVSEIRYPRINSGQYRASITASKLVAGPE